MTVSIENEGTHEVPTQIFETFLQNLESSGVSSQLAKRLRNTLLEEHAYTERALKTAILGEE